LIGRANYKDGHFYKKTIRVDVKRGQNADSLETLKNRWGWSRGKVSRFLNLLETEGMIAQQRGNLTTLITICNYNTYQLDPEDSGKANSKADSNPNGKADGQATVRRTDRQREPSNKNKEESKRIKTFPENSNEFRLSLFLLNHIRNNKPDFKKPNLQLWARSADAILRIDQRPIEKVKQVIAWCQTDEFWKVNILSMSKLRKQFDALEIKMESGEGKAPRNKPPENRMTQKELYEFIRQGVSETKDQDDLLKWLKERDKRVFSKVSRHAPFLHRRPETYMIVVWGRYKDEDDDE